MRNLLIAAVGAVTLSALVACSDTPTEPVSSSSPWFSSSDIVVSDNPFADTWNPSAFGATAPGQTAANYCGFYSGLVGETWEVGVKWESDDGVGNLPTVGGFTFDLHNDTYLDWAATGHNDMRMVLVKAGNEHNLYFYNGIFPGEGAGDAPSADSDEGLHAPPVGQGNIPTVSHFAYCYVAGDNGNGYEGCTIGYWMNHDGAQRSGRGPDRFRTDSWQHTDYLTDTLLHDVFEIGAAFDIDSDDTFRMAIEYRGGPTLTDAAQLLLRQAVAGLLSATYEKDGETIDYEWSAETIIAEVNEALASEDRQTILDLAGTLDAMNNAGCPL
jgi:hypothetical protein